MTPQTPSSSDESSFPRKSRADLGKIIKDSTELDLWAFDDLDPAEDMAPKPQAPLISSAIPMPRDRRKKVSPDPDAAPDPTSISTGRKSAGVEIRQQPIKTSDATTADGNAITDDFDDFDDFEEPDHGEDREPPALSIHPSLLGDPGESAPLEEPVADETTPPPTKPRVEVLDEFSPIVPENAKPISLIPHLQLSKVEWIGLSALCAILLVGAVVVFLNSIHRLPAGAERLTAGDFPVEGRHLTILSAESFWRAPVSEGKDAETFRRGTQLLPVVELTSSGSPGAVRVIFRDEDGRGQGDVLTRAIQPGVPLQIAATAGFEDVGMHAAYRTGQNEPWTIEVLEGPSESAPNADFQKLFEIDISTDRR